METSGLRVISLIKLCRHKTSAAALLVSEEKWEYTKKREKEKENINHLCVHIIRLAVFSLICYL